MLMTSVFALIAMDFDTQRRPRTPQPPPPPMQTVPMQAPPAPPSLVYPAPPVATPPPPAPPPLPAAPPTPPRRVSGSISDADYPAAAVHYELGGSTRVQLVVGTDGRAKSCDILTSSGTALLDQTTCRLITRRFRFQPAARDGQPVESTAIQVVSWRLPEGNSSEPPTFPLMQFTPGRLVWTVAATGYAVTNCKFDLTGATFSAFKRDECTDPDSTRLLDLEEGRPPVEVVYVADLVPQGSPGLRAAAGRPSFQESFELEIGPGGEVTQCTSVAQVGEAPEYVDLPFRFSCDGLLIGKRFAPGAEAVRRAQLRQVVYVAPTGRPGANK